MNPDQYLIDLSTERVNPNNPAQVRKGEAPRTAFTKINHFMTEVVGYLWHIDVLPPDDPIAYMTWLDTSVDPAMIRRRNKDNTDWITIGPALDASGTSLFANLTSASPDADKLEARNILQLGVFATLNDESTPEQVTAARNLLGEFGPVFPADTKIYGVQNKQPVELNVYSRLTDTSSDTDKANARGLMGLGSASILNVPEGQTGFGSASAATLTTSATDTTAGRVLKVNDFGLGGYANVPAGSVLTQDLPTGFFYASGNTDLPAGVGTFGFLDVRRFNATYRQLTYRPWSTTSSWVNVMSAGTWTGWRQQFDEGNCTVTTNSNGTSYRFPNGLQIWFSGTVSLTSSLAEIAFPITQAFIGRCVVHPCVIPSSTYNTSGGTAWGGGAAATFKPNAAMPGNLVMLSAIGVWK